LFAAVERDGERRRFLSAQTTALPVTPPLLFMMVVMVVVVVMVVLFFVLDDDLPFQNRRWRQRIALKKSTDGDKYHPLGCQTH
jgi:hypothetical protein